MNDTWSLKNKELKEMHINHTDGTSVSIRLPDFCEIFQKKDIEMLYQKLIEDIEEINIKMRHSDLRLDQESMYKDDVTDLILGFRKNINKRFGKEEAK